MTDDTTSLLLELVAFELFSETQSSPEPAICAELWREADDATRLRFRTAANNFIERLKGHAVQVKITNAKKASDALDAVITIPARKAYVLGGSTAKIT